ncbi:SGNH/GDSL hydrolase family protein [Larkinella soli]|uniref:SGNH/GDSL hydrolase family protein n=1 Tax=Larkinella soli TaxID=1770527 RepID=UPI000FFBDC5A|nr:SGNH/GDSL hydrolase family protein [Larkinella soli]
MKNNLIRLCFLLLNLPLLAQTPPVELSWWNPAEHPEPVIEGQAWPKERKLPYDRLPGRAEGKVRDVVWRLSRQGAGLMIRFRATTDQVVVEYGTTGNHAMPHMPATGVSGVDLYALNADGDWRWCAGKYSFGDTVRYRFPDLEANDRYHQKGREYRLYLPLYNGVKWLRIGVPKGVAFSPLPVRMDKPVVIYGTSIAQGACASRPGMAWTAILGRKLDRPVINLGFSGNGRMEPEMVGFLPEIDAKVFVIDCLPNLISTVNIPAEEIRKRYVEAVRLLRQKRPATPILLVEHAGYTEGGISPVRKKYYTEANELLRQTFAQLKAEGIDRLYLLPFSEIALDQDAMVDGTHPSDLGMQQYADAYERSLRTILNEPTGPYDTMKPCIQYRDANIYDWDARHQSILAQIKAKPPRAVFLGNSITHFWGREPKSAITTGSDSWEAVMAPQGVMNLGYGWDRVENVLWRVYHDELDGYKAARVLIMIGTNNIGLNSDAEIVAGLKLLVLAVKARQPGAGVVLIGLLPRRKEETRVAGLNESIARACGELDVTYANPGTVFLNAEGRIDESLFSDGLHPNAAGYRKLAEKLSPYLK